MTAWAATAIAKSRYNVRVRHLPAVMTQTWPYPDSHAALLGGIGRGVVGECRWVVWHGCPDGKPAKVVVAIPGTDDAAVLLELRQAREMRSASERGRTFCEFARPARSCGGSLLRALVNVTGGLRFRSSTAHSRRTPGAATTRRSTRHWANAVVGLLQSERRLTRALRRTASQL